MAKGNPAASPLWANIAAVTFWGSGVFAYFDSTDWGDLFITWLLVGGGLLFMLLIVRLAVLTVSIGDRAGKSMKSWLEDE